MLALDPKPVWMIEVLPFQEEEVGGSDGQYPDVFSTMRQAGYRSYHIAPDGKLPEFVGESEPLDMLRQGSSGNYLFVDHMTDTSDLI